MAMLSAHTRSSGATGSAQGAKSTPATKCTFGPETLLQCYP
jgi:hypothetical protein